MRVIGSRILFVAAALWTVGWIALFVGVPTPLDYVLGLVRAPYEHEPARERLVDYLSFLPAVVLFVAAWWHCLTRSQRLFKYCSYFLPSPTSPHGGGGDRLADWPSGHT
jgi:hypothetical protein